MGILSHADHFKSKYLVAIILGPGQQANVVHVKHWIHSELFLVDLHGTKYVFRAPSRAQMRLGKEYNKTQVLIVTTDMLHPITYTNTELDMTLRHLGIDKVDNAFVQFLYNLRDGTRDAAIERYKSQLVDKTQIANANNLGSVIGETQISRLRDLSYKLDDIINPPGKLFDNFIQSARDSIGNKVVINKPVTPVKAWLKVCLGGLCIGGLLLSVFALYDAGYLDNIRDVILQ